jgi:hypothetical protein
MARHGSPTTRFKGLLLKLRIFLKQYQKSILACCVGGFLITAWHWGVQHRSHLRHHRYRALTKTSVTDQQFGGLSWERRSGTSITEPQHSSVEGNAALLVLMVINHGAFSFFTNWHCHYQCTMEPTSMITLRRVIGLPINMIVRAADGNVLQTLQDRAWSDDRFQVRVEPAALTSSIPAYQAMKAVNDQFYALEREKFRALLDLLDHSITNRTRLYLLVSDADVVFLREPLTEMLQNGQADLYMQCDGCNTEQYGPRYTQCSYQYNTGIMLLVVDRQTRVGRKRYWTLRQLIHQVVWQSKQTENERQKIPGREPVHDQFIFNRVLREWTRSGAVELVAPYRNATVANTQQSPRLRIMYLPYQSFPNGCILFGYRNRKKATSVKTLLQNGSVVAVHANYRSGAQAKRDALRSVGAWIAPTDRWIHGLHECPPCKPVPRPTSLRQLHT